MFWFAFFSSSGEQVKVATVKHLWEKVAAIRRTKALGSDDLKVSNYELKTSRPHVYCPPDGYDSSALVAGCWLFRKIVFIDCLRKNWSEPSWFGFLVVCVLYKMMTSTHTSLLRVNLTQEQSN